MNFLTEFVMRIANSSAKTLCIAVLLMIAGLIGIKILLTVVRRVLAHSVIDSVLYKFILNCIRVVCLVVLVTSVLNYMGLPMTSLLTVLAAAGAAIALAIKDSLSNFVGGILIMINKPFSRGDLIEINGVSGKVYEIDLLYSKLITYNNQHISIPNSIIANNTLINYFGAEDRRIDVKMSASYDADIDHVKAVIRRVIDEGDYFIKEREPLVGVSSYGDSAVIYDAFAWCRSDDYFDARYYLLEHLKKAFDREGIEIPYSQIVIHEALPSSKTLNGAESLDGEEHGVK